MRLITKKTQKLLQKAEESPTNITFNELEHICDSLFEKRPKTGGSHIIYKTPWQGDPRINIQRAANGKAKVYQVKAVIEAYQKLIETGAS